MTSCPSDFSLDELSVLGDDALDAGALRAHIERCGSCARGMEERRATTAEFRAKRRALPLSRRSTLRWLWIPGAVAALVVCLVLVPHTPYTGAKGVAHEIYCKRGETVLRLTPGQSVRPGDALRFSLRPANPQERHAVIASVDGGGHYSPLYPPSADGASVEIPGDGSPLDGSIVLDAAPGPESLVIVTAQKPFSAAMVRQAVLRDGAGAHARTLEEQGLTVNWMTFPKVVP
jgi:hypothetical protein